MTKDNAAQLSRLGDIATIEEQEAAQAFAGCLQKHAQHCRQIEELKRYRQDYAKRLSGERGMALSAGEAHQLARFIANLDTLLGTMAAQEKHLKHELQISEQAWRTLKGKVKGFEKLAAKRRHKARQQNEQRKNNQLDDAWLARHLTT